MGGVEWVPRRLERGGEGGGRGAWGEVGGWEGGRDVETGIQSNEFAF